MIFDILVVVIVLGTMISSYRQGFLENVINTTGWVIGVIVGLVFSPFLRSILIAKTQLDETFYMRVKEKTDYLFDPMQLEAGLPDIIQDSFAEFMEKLAGTASDSLASSLTVFAMSVLSFIILAVACHLLFRIILFFGSKKKSKNILGTIDGFLGLLFGFIKGVIYVFILMALLFPFATMARPETYDMIMDNLYASHIALELYDNNLLMLIIGGLM